MRCVGVAAGEASGDAIGEGLVRAIKAKYPNCDVVGITGPKMEAAGARSLYSIDDLSVMGVSEVLGKLPHILKVRRGLIRQLKALKPDVFVGIDAPDFNLGVEKALKQDGIHTVHYVSPSIWAWKGWRVHKIKKATDSVLCTMPFEPAYYERVNHRALFVGHPLASQVDTSLSKADYQKQLNLDENVSYVGILPGSRGFEIKNLCSVFLEAARLFADQHPGVTFLLPVAKASLKATIEDKLSFYPKLNVKLVEGQAQTVLGAADVAILASGTVALEAALLNTPSVVGYRLSALSYAIGKRMIKTKYISLPNIILDQPYFPELIQDALTPQAISEALSRLYENRSDGLLDQTQAIRDALTLDASELALAELERVCGC